VDGARAGRQIDFDQPIAGKQSARSAVTLECYEAGMVHRGVSGRRKTRRSRGEVEARPSVGSSEERESRIGVDGSRVANDAEHRHVRVAVAEREALVEIEATRFRMVAHEAGLVGPATMGLMSLPVAMPFFISR